jgi:hypothetical protein
MTFTGTADLGSSAARATMGELGQLVMTGCNSAAHVAVGVTGCKAHDYDRNFVALRAVAIALGVSGMTTMVDHNDIRLQPIERVTGTPPNSQVSDGSRHRAASSQAKDQCQPFLDGVLACADRPVQRQGTATHARYGCPGRASAHALGCTG